MPKRKKAYVYEYFERDEDSGKGLCKELKCAESITVCGTAKIVQKQILKFIFLVALISS